MCVQSRTHVQNSKTHVHESLDRGHLESITTQAVRTTPGSVWQSLYSAGEYNSEGHVHAEGHVQRRRVYNPASIIPEDHVPSSKMTCRVA